MVQPCTHDILVDAHAARLAPRVVKKCVLCGTHLYLGASGDLVLCVEERRKPGSGRDNGAPGKDRVSLELHKKWHEAWKKEIEWLDHVMRWQTRPEGEIPKTKPGKS